LRGGAERVLARNQPADSGNLANSGGHAALRQMGCEGGLSDSEGYGGAEIRLSGVALRESPRPHGPKLRELQRPPRLRRAEQEQMRSERRARSVFSACSVRRKQSDSARTLARRPRQLVLAHHVSLQRKFPLSSGQAFPLLQTSGPFTRTPRARSLSIPCMDGKRRACEQPGARSVRLMWLASGSSTPRNCIQRAVAGRHSPFRHDKQQRNRKRKNYRTSRAASRSRAPQAAAVLHDEGHDESRTRAATRQPCSSCVPPRREQ
jgi:hypothetical protein